MLLSHREEEKQEEAEHRKKEAKEEVLVQSALYSRRIIIILGSDQLRYNSTSSKNITSYHNTPLVTTVLLVGNLDRRVEEWWCVLFSGSTL